VRAQIQLERLSEALEAKAEEFDDVLKMGRTQMQDAVPIRLGQEFRAYSWVVRRDIARFERAKDEMRRLNMGGTAIGTGINADERYLRRIIPNLSKVTGLELVQASDLIDATQNLDGLVAVSGAVKTCAVNLSKMSNDLRPRSSGPGADALQDGKIDAAFVVAGAPTVAITTLATAKDTYLVGLDDEHIAKLQESSPYYEEYIIPEGTYEGVPETKTVAVVATVIARDDVSEDDVYNICYTIFENMDNLAHDKAGELDVEFASGVTAVPYHAGAAKYFAEKGFDVPTK